jgi:type II secretory pathway pseudopilin PulG
MRRLRPRADPERGETLLELLIAITILGVCVVAIGSGIATSIAISVVHRNQAAAQDSLHNYAETLQSHYVACTSTTPPNYAALLAQLAPPGFSAPTATVQSWAPTGGPSQTGAFVGGCPSGDTGLQQVTLTLISTTGRVSESLVVDLRSQS